jgi:hypothetical protein
MADFKAKLKHNPHASFEYAQFATDRNAAQFCHIQFPAKSPVD